MIPTYLIAARGRVARSDCIRIRTVESKKQASPGFPAPRRSGIVCGPSSLAFPTRRVSSAGMDTDPAGESRCAPALGEACVLDPARPCRACLAPSPRDCPYLYLLYDVGAPVPPPGRPGARSEVNVRQERCPYQPDLRPTTAKPVRAAQNA
jgi:hypothetical protein